MADLSRTSSGLLAVFIANDASDPFSVSDWEAQDDIDSVTVDGTTGRLTVNGTGGLGKMSTVRLTTTASRTKRMIQAVYGKPVGDSGQHFAIGAHMETGSTGNQYAGARGTITRSTEHIVAEGRDPSNFKGDSTVVTTKSAGSFYRFATFVDGADVWAYDFTDDTTVTVTGVFISSGYAGVALDAEDNLLVDEFWDCADRYITCTGLPAGYKLKVRNGSATVLASATESSGTATLDLIDVDLSDIADAVVTNGSDTVQATYTPSAGDYVAGGDTFEFSQATAPADPTNLTATLNGQTQIDLSWTDNASTETAYLIERDSGGGFSQIDSIAANSTSYSDSGLSRDTQYTYRVRCTDGSLNSGYSNTDSATTAPSDPSGLSATAISDSRIDLAWTDNSSTETAYLIERSPDGSTGWTQIDSVAANSTSYSDTGLASSTTYYYRVRAQGPDGNSSYTSTANATTQAASSETPASNVGGSTAVERSFEIIVYEKGQDIDGTVDFTITSDLLVEPLEYGGSTARVLEGASQSLPYTIKFIDLDGSILPELWDSDGMLQVLGRVVEVELTEDGSTSTVDVRRIGAIRAVEHPIIELHLVDELAFDNTMIFENNQTIQVALRGPDSGITDWAGVTYNTLVEVTNGDFEATIIDSNGDFRRLDFGGIVIPDAQFKAIREDVIDSPSGSPVAGNFNTLVIELDGTERFIASFGDLTAATKEAVLNVAAWEGGVGSADGIVQIPDAWVDWSAGGTSGTVDVRLYFGLGDGVPTTPDLPYLVTETGVRTLLSAVMDGDYGGNAMRYELPASTDDLPNSLSSPLELAIPGPVKRTEFLQQLAKAAGFVLWTNKEGKIVPKVWPVPPNSDFTQAELDALYHFDGSTAITVPTYEVNHSNAYNVWEMKGILVEEVGSGAARLGGSPFFEHAMVRGTIEKDATSSSPITSTRRVYEAGMEGLVLDDINVGADSVADLFLRNTLGGLAEGRILGHATADAPMPGDLVVLDHDELKGLNSVSEARSGIQLARVVDKRKTYQNGKVAFEYRLIYSGEGGAS